MLPDKATELSMRMLTTQETYYVVHMQERFWLPHLKKTKNQQEGVP
jgi:hypothetical protein